LNIDFTRDTVSGHKIYLILDQDSVLLLTKELILEMENPKRMTVAQFFESDGIKE